MTPHVKRRTSAAAALGVVAFGYRYLSYSEFSNDHYVHLSRAQQWLAGEWPVKDFVDPGMPLMYALSAAAQSISPGLHTELLLICAAFAAATALSMLVAARMADSLAIGVLAALVPLAAAPMSYSYPKMLPYAAALAAIAVYACRPTMVRMAALAAITAAAFLLRHDHGVIIGASLAVALACTASEPAVLRRRLTAFAAITVLLLTPFLVWVQLWEGIPTYVADGVAFSSRESEKAVYAPPIFRIDGTQPLIARAADRLERPKMNVRWVSGITDARRQERARQLGLITASQIGDDAWQYELTDWSTDAVRAIVTDPEVADTHGVDRATYEVAGAPGVIARLRAAVPEPGPGVLIRPNAVTMLFYLSWLLPVAAVAILLFDRSASDSRAVVAAAAVMQIVMNLTMLRDPLDTRIRDVLAPGAVLLAFTTAYLWRRRSLRGGAGIRAVAATTIIVALLAAATVGAVGERVREMGAGEGMSGLAERLNELRGSFQPPHERTGRVPPEYAPAVTYLSACMPSSSRLFSMAFLPELFFHTGRPFAGGHVLFTPGYYLLDRHATQTLDRLAREDVPFVVIDSETWPEMQRLYPRISAHVSGRYREVVRYTIALGRDLVVLADLSRPVGGRFGEAGLPCFNVESSAS